MRPRKGYFRRWGEFHPKPARPHAPAPPRSYGVLFFDQGIKDLLISGFFGMVFPKFAAKC